jgi:enoyl-CoA hydratase/carnithine racemase
MSTADDETDGRIGVAVDGAVGRLTLDHPRRRNAISSAMWTALPAAVETLAADPAVRVIVIAGAGENFSAGADISEFAAVFADRTAAAKYAAGIAMAMNAVCACEKPTLAAIRGSCIGSGLGLALCCDLRLATTDSTFAITPGKLGLAYSFADTLRLVNIAGVSAAKDLLLTARAVRGEEARAMRLVDRLYGPATLDEAVDGCAAQIAATSSVSARIAKQFIAHAVAGQQAENEQTLSACLDAVSGADFAEGQAAFLGHRPPRFQR